MRPCNLHIAKTLELVEEMIDLANHGDSDREDNGCGILYGILRDSAYKLKKLAEEEKENHIRKGWWPVNGMDENGMNTKNERRKQMVKNFEVYKCEACGNIVEVLHGGEGELVCCGEAMQKMVENTVDAAKEKHVPVVETVEGGVKVKVGDVAHPMEEKHYIEWIEIIGGGKVDRQLLCIGEAPEAVFKTDAQDVTARGYCNLHGLWKG